MVFNLRDTQQMEQRKLVCVDLDGRGVLREVIGALADKCSGRGGRKVHIPFRNSKITTILQPGLEGTGRCSTVVTLRTAL